MEQAAQARLAEIQAMQARETLRLRAQRQLQKQRARARQQQAQQALQAAGTAATGAPGAVTNRSALEEDADQVYNFNLSSSFPLPALTWSLGSPCSLGLKLTIALTAAMDP